MRGEAENFEHPGPLLFALSGHPSTSAMLTVRTPTAISTRACCKQGRLQVPQVPRTVGDQREFPCCLIIICVQPDIPCREGILLVLETEGHSFSNAGAEGEEPLT